jgi:ribosomal protein L7/L12
MEKLAFAQMIGLLTHWGMRQLDTHELQELNAITTPPFAPSNDLLGLIVDLIKAQKAGQKIEAIKAVRAMTGLGLKEAKDLIEQNW